MLTTSKYRIHSVQRVSGLLSEHMQQELCWVAALATLPALAIERAHSIASLPSADLTHTMNELMHRNLSYKIKSVSTYLWRLRPRLGHFYFGRKVTTSVTNATSWIMRTSRTPAWW